MEEAAAILAQIFDNFNGHNSNVSVTNAQVNKMLMPNRGIAGAAMMWWGAAREARR